MKIDCISDLHGHYPELEGGDLLIVAGDLTARHTIQEYSVFKHWFFNQCYKKKILVAGNHDTFLDGNPSRFTPDSWFSYLEDTGTQFDSFKVWGSPWTKKFHGMNPRCMAFTVDTDEELAEKWTLIPDDIDILITHCPPSGFFDEVIHESKWGNHRENTGSVSLRNNVMDRIKPQAHVFGHIHEWGGKMIDTCVTKFINASHVNEYYKPINAPVRINL